MKFCPVCKQEYIADQKACLCIEVAPVRLVLEEDLYSGRMIDGRFKVLNKLGGGGMGSVYLAEQVDVKKKIAIKILKPEYAVNPEYVKQFCSTARLAAGLKHPNIATVIDFDQTTDGCLFIAMDYVEGEPLRKLIEKTGRLEIGRALRFGEQIAEGLAAAHRRGLLHRDIRPENILILGDGETVKITDFAIPRIEDVNSSTRMTVAEVALGTPEYTAPEQVGGSEPTEQTDIYALGIVLYEMLTGQVPFKAATHLSTLLCQINEAPKPLRQLRAEIPTLVQSVVMQTLEKKPEKRQQTMARVGKELNKCAKSSGPHYGVLLPTTVAAANAAPIPRQQLRWKAVSGVAAGLLAAAGYFVFFWESTPVSSAPMVAMAPQRAATGEAAVAAVDLQGSNAVNDIPPPPTIAKIDEKPLQVRVAVTEVKPPEAKIEARLPAETKQLAAIVKPAAPNPIVAIAPEKKAKEEPTPVESRPVAQPLPVPQPLPQPRQQPLPAPVVKVDERELARIHNLIEQRLRNQGLLKVSESDRWGVTVDAGAGGVVVLRGTLRDQKLREEAVRVVRDIPGVSDVRTSITLQIAPDGG